MNPVATIDIVPPLTVDLGERSYGIRIVDGAVRDAAAHAAFWTDALPGSGDIALVSNETVMPLYGLSLEAALGGRDRRVVSITVPDGERFKDQALLDTIHDAMLEARLDRGVTVVALGGGVIGDVAGFAAATYQRGVRVLQVPTTLLAQVDSSVGGKTGINHRLGKNMIGAFHQPSGVVIDVATLDTLPAREYAAGLAEVVKYGASLDAPFFAWLEESIARLVARDRATLAHAIRRCCALKAEVVGADERESGQRALLNFGHTFGHAIEGATGYGTWLHGEAVSAGMVMAARLSLALGLIDGRTVDRLIALLDASGLPVAPPPLSGDEWRRWMSTDKKSEGGRLRFIVMDALGRARATTVDDAVLDGVLRATARSDGLATATARA